MIKPRADTGVKQEEPSRNSSLRIWLICLGLCAANGVPFFATLYIPNTAQASMSAFLGREALGLHFGNASLPPTAPPPKVDQASGTSASLRTLRHDDASLMFGLSREDQHVELSPGQSPSTTSILAPPQPLASITSRPTLLQGLPNRGPDRNRARL